MNTSPGWSPAFSPLKTSPGWADATCDPVDITLGDIRLRTAGAGPAGGEWQFEVHDIVGWWESPGDLSSLTDHPSGDGQIAGHARLDGRTVTIQGAIEATGDYGPASLEAALDHLAAMRRSLLVVHEPHRGLRREADVRVLRLAPDRRAPWFAFATVTLVADDPLRHSSERRTLVNGSNALANRGDVDAWPLIRLVGPHSAVTITSPGGTVSLAAIGPGVTRVVDCRNGAILDADGNRLAASAQGWVRIPPGGATVTVAGLGTGSASATRTEAWS